jgi:hypothetical protein
MRRQLPWSSYLIFAFLAVGIIASLRALIIPVCVLGAIFLLYKFPPSSWKKVTMYRKDDKKRRNAKFRVISGSKNSDSEDPRRYH